MAENNGKKSNGASANAAGPAKRTGIAEFIGDVKAELFRIHWTSKEELRVYTKIVVVATFVLGMAIYSMDLIIQIVLAGVGTILRLITG